MRISLKLTLAFSVLVAFVIAMGFLGMKYIGDIHRSLENVSNNALPSVRYSGAIRAEALDFRNRETQLLLVKNAKEMSELESKLAVTLGSVDVSFTAAFGPVLGLNKEEIATWYTYHERFLTPCSPKNGPNPKG